MYGDKKGSLLTATMDNGQRVIAVPVKGSRTATFIRIYKAGATYEEGFGAGSNDGISHFLEHMVFKVDKEKHQGDINEAFTKLGAEINAATSFDMTFYHSKGPARNFELATDLWSKMLTEITIDREEFEAEKQVVLQEIKSRDDMPEGATLRGAISNLFNGTPLQHTNLGTAESVSGITPKMMQDYVDTYYTPENSFIVVTGSIKWPGVYREIERLFETEKPKERANSAKDPWKNWKPGWKGNHEAIIKPSNIPLTYVALAWELPGTKSNYVYPQDLVNTLIGNSKTSLVFKEIIGKGITSTLSYFSDVFPAISVGGLFYTSPPEKMTEIHGKVIANVLKKVREMLVTQDLVKRLKEEVIGGYNLYVEDPLSLGLEIAMREVKTGKEMAPEEYIERIKNVTIEEVKDVINSCFEELEFTMHAIGTVPDDWEPELSLDG